MKVSSIIILSSFLKLLFYIASYIIVKKKLWLAYICRGELNPEIKVRVSLRDSIANNWRNKRSLVPHVRIPRYFANKSPARYKWAFEEYTKRHAKRGGTATPWSNLEVSSVGRRSFVSRQHLRESLFSPCRPSPPPPPAISFSRPLSLALPPRLTTPALNPRGFAHMSTIYFLPAHKSFSG